jgi:hypothetical protein
MSTMDKAARDKLISGLRRIWEGHSDYRLGQALRLAVNEAIREPARMRDAWVATAVARAAERYPGQSPKPGPYWDTDTPTSLGFMSSTPRDPERIPRVLAALAFAWDANAGRSFGETLADALDWARITENEFNSRLLLIEDAPMGRILGEFATHLSLRGEADIRLWVDDDLVDRRAPAGWIQATTAHAAIRALKTGRVVELSLDHDLGHVDKDGRGINIVNFLGHSREVRGRDLWPRDGITLHTANPAGRDAMARAIRADAGRRYRVSETRTPGGKPRLRFTIPDSAQ